MSIILESFIPGFSRSALGGLFFALAIGILFWEHFGRKYGSNYRPSIGLDSLSNKSRNLFCAFGRKCAWISSYLTQIDLKEIGMTIEDVITPTWNLLTSPFYMIYGYVHTAATYGKKQWMVYFGSAIGLLLISYGTCKYIDIHPLSYLFWLCNWITINFL